MRIEQLKYIYWSINKVYITNLTRKVIIWSFFYLFSQTVPFSTNLFTGWVKNMLAMYLKYHKAGLTPTTPVTSTAISPVKMLIGHKSLTNFRSEIIFLQGKPVFYIFLPSTSPYWQIILRFCWQWTPTWLQKGKVGHMTSFGCSRVLSLPYETYMRNSYFGTL